MTRRPPSLLRTLVRSLLVPVAVAGVVGVLVVYLLVREEYDELQDQSLQAHAHLLLRLIETTADRPGGPDLATVLAAEAALLDATGASHIWLLDPAGKVIAATPGTDPARLPADLGPGLHSAGGMRLAVLGSGRDAERRLVYAVEMSERNEAITEVITGVILGFILLGVLSAAAAYLTVRRSARMIAALSDNISEKDADNLSPIDRRNAFAEFDPAIDRIDRLMARLEAALSAERAFATNAAHELRTPVAISLAHTQRLKAQLSDPATIATTLEVEQGLKRLTRLIERLLQMSRAQSGLGIAAATTDLAPVIALLLKELRDREPNPESLVIRPPAGAWLCPVDPDALGIILNNLFDNALKYRAGPGPVTVDASEPGQVRVANDCAPLSRDDLEAIKTRFVRKASLSDGFGLGLSIVQDLCAKSGCTFDIASPQPGSARGFAATVRLPLRKDTSPA